MLFAKITQKITQNLYLFHVFYSQITLFCLQILQENVIMKPVLKYFNVVVSETVYI